MRVNSLLKLTTIRKFFRDLSIQEKLPLFISILLLCVIVTFSLTSYYGVRNAAIQIGKERLRSVTEQVGSMLTQSLHNSTSATHSFILNDSIKEYLLTGKKELQPGVFASLRKLKKDSSWISAELLDAKGITVLRTDSAVMELKIAPLSILPLHSDTVRLGKMYAVNDSIFFPIIARITEKANVVGYVLIWRKLQANKRNIDQVNKLLGTNAIMYFGNSDGKFWTDMINPVNHTSIDMQKIKEVYNYKNRQGNKVIAAAQTIPNSEMVLLIEFPKNAVLDPATRFLNWIFSIGAVLFAIGIFFTWIMSRNIIKPLNQLTKATIAISKGKYMSPVNIHQNDELGKLANAFNVMAAKVHLTQEDLEKQVKDRTLQLESANKELEAFTYSVSHDLRAPLRGIIGFTTILEEEYTSKLDEEAKRLAAVIKNNAQIMGNLIDDLLNFSRQGKQTITKSTIDNNTLVKEIIKDMTGPGDMVNWIIQPLPEIQGDLSAIRQVWTNLLSNGIKYSRNVPAPKIEIGSFPRGEEIVFFVKDNGAGFEQKYSEKLFKVFQRLHSVHEFEGTGVGLAIVEKVISKHGGKVWAEAELNNGATFYFSLPKDC